MRHIRTRRRYRFILFLLFVICLTVFVENRIEDLLPQLKSVAEAKVEDAMGGRVSFSVGSISGGIVHPMVLNDIRMRKKGSSEFSEDLVIDSIRTSYYFKDIIKVMGGRELPPIINRNSSAYVKFSVNRGSVKGFIGLYGDLTDSRIDGYLSLRGGSKINFGGGIKSGAINLEIRPDSPGAGSVRVAGALSPGDDFIIKLKFDHLRLKGFDIACDAVLRITLKQAADGSGPESIDGEFDTDKFALNFKPFVDIRSKFRVTREMAELTGFNLGEVIKAFGKMSFGSYRDIDLTVQANNVSLTWLMGALNTREASSILTGNMNGKFVFKGPAGKVNMGAAFDIRGGTMGKLDFDYLTASLNGDLPYLKIDEARVTRKSGYFSIAGELDLRKAGKNNFFDDVKLVSDDTAIAWDEWSSAQGKDVKEQSMKKNVGGQFGFGYKKYVREDKLVDESLRYSDEMHLDYKLQPTDSLKVMVGQDKDFFGFEHKDKF